MSMGMNCQFQKKVVDFTIDLYELLNAKGIIEQAIW